MKVRPPVRRLPPHALQLGWTLFFVVLVLLLVNAVGWVYYRTLRVSWEQELSRSLTAVAATAASRITHDELEDLLSKGEFGFAYATLRQQLLRTRQTTGWLRNAFILDRQGRTLLDLEADPPLPGKNPVLALDPAAADSALLGRATASRMFEVGRVYYKVGYAPVSPQGALADAALAVEADATFFSGLDRLRRQLLLIALGSTAAVLLLGFFLLRATRSLLAAEDRVRRSETLASMGELAATMAHEIRNPLAIIRATAERLRKAPPDDEIWHYIPEEVERLNGIVSTYLDFARTEPGRTVRMDLRESVERVRLLCAPALTKGGIQVQADTAEGGPAWIDGNPPAIRQVLLNLMLNAQEAMPRGGTLGLSVRRSDRGWLCQVRDTGHGIPRERLRRIFDAFYSNKERGTGLGLTVVNRIVKEHRGHIEVESAPGRGTTFRILLPVSEDKE